MHDLDGDALVERVVLRLKDGSIPTPMTRVILYLPTLLPDERVGASSVCG